MDMLQYYNDIAERADYEALCEKYDSVTAYAFMVMNTDYGRLCGIDEKLACARHLRDMIRSEADDPEFPYVSGTDHTAFCKHHTDRCSKRDHCVVGLASI